jgi:hypothetical protein
MPLDKWFNIGKDITKLAVIKDWIDKDILQPYYLVLSEDYGQFIKRTSIYNNKNNKAYKTQLLSKVNV